MVSPVCLHISIRLTHWVRYDDAGCGYFVSHRKIMAKMLTDQKSLKFYKIGLNLGVLFNNYDQFKASISQFILSSQFHPVFIFPRKKMENDLER